MAGRGHGVLFRVRHPPQPPAQRGRLRSATPRIEREYCDQARRSAAPIEGWLSDAQGEALLRAAADVPPGGIIMEIGSWKGRSTVWLAYGARLAGARMLAVDPHEGSRENPAANTYPEFLLNLRNAGIERVVVPLLMTSQAAAREVSSHVDLLFVDGDHSLNGATADADVWLPRLAAGGVVMFHDVATSGYSGPRRVFQQRVCANVEYHRVRKVGSMGIAERTRRRSRTQGIRSTMFAILLYWYDVQGAIKRALRRLRRPLGPGRSKATSSL